MTENHKNEECIELQTTWSCEEMKMFKDDGIFIV